MIWLTFALVIGQVLSEEWDASNFPNPTVSQFRQCGMRTRASICDPDGVLTEADRYRLDHELKQLEARTRQENGATFCEKKGITPALAITRHVRGGSTEAVKTMANDMLRRWTLDSQCQKAMVIVVSTDDMKFWVARDDKVPIYAEEFTDIFNQNKRHFQQGDYQQAISNVLKSTWERSVTKQGTPQGRPDSPRPAFGFGDGGGGQPKPSGGGMRGGGGGGPAFKMPSIPGWVWLALIFGVIPLLCCCLCCYLCCCRRKGSPEDGSHPAQPNQPSGGGGGGRSPFGNLITSMGGAGIGSLIGNLISNRNRGGGGGGGGSAPYGGGGAGGYGGGGYGGGGYGGGGGRGMGYDPNPVYDDNQGRGGRGLYPSANVKDQGGGGSWG